MARRQGDSFFEEAQNQRIRALADSVNETARTARTTRGNPMTRSEITNPTRLALWRRITLSGIVLTAMLGLCVSENDARASSTPEPRVVTTGQPIPGMASYDAIITRLMRDHDIPGAAVAVVRHGRLSYARGFGMADRENGVPVRPGTRSFVSQACPNQSRHWRCSSSSKTGGSNWTRGFFVTCSQGLSLTWL